MTAKLSISLSPDDVAFLDSVAARFDGNRSAAVHDLIRLGRQIAAGDDYERAFDEWESSDDATAWEMATGDGIAR